VKLIPNFCTLLAGSLLAVSVLVAPSEAQLPANATVYASGLEGPRGLAFGSDGALYVSEAVPAVRSLRPESANRLSVPLDRRG
jgi:hypothetical protein